MPIDFYRLLRCLTMFGWLALIGCQRVPEDDSYDPTDDSYSLDWGTSDWVPDTYEVRCGPSPIGNRNKTMCFVPGEQPPYPGVPNTGPFLIDQYEYTADSVAKPWLECPERPIVYTNYNFYTALDRLWQGTPEASRVSSTLMGRRPALSYNPEQAEWFCGCEGKHLTTPCEWSTAAMGTDERINVNGPLDRRLVPAGVLARYKTGVMDGCWQGFVPPTPAPEDLPYEDFPIKAGLFCLTPWPVGSIPEDVSPYGVYDMSGNASELVSLPPDWESSPASFCVRNPGEIAGPELVPTMGATFFRSGQYVLRLRRDVAWTTV